MLTAANYYSYTNWKKALVIYQVSQNTYFSIALHSSYRVAESFFFFLDHSHPLLQAEKACKLDKGLTLIIPRASGQTCTVTACACSKRHAAG